jgi:hypothetical protein
MGTEKFEMVTFQRLRLEESTLICLEKINPKSGYIRIRAMIRTAVSTLTPRPI